MTKTVIAAFYRFVSLPDFEALKTPMLEFCNSHEIKGTILLAGEGINATISGTEENINAYFSYLDSDPRLKNMEWKESFAGYKPFERMKVRLKKEIVRMGIEDLNIDNRGIYVEPEQWDRLISDPEVTVIDTRNEYEILLGRFKGAVNPKTKEFRSFPKWVKENLNPKKDKKVAMYCTGGIRCEKSTALLKQSGFREVYHLNGGILKYLEKTGNKSNVWEGGCFVFDDRIAVDKDLKPSKDLLCKNCEQPVTVDEIKTSSTSRGVTCSSCLKKPVSA